MTTQESKLDTRTEFASRHDLALFDAHEATPAQAWDRDSTKRALDELFSLTFQYRSSAAYLGLLQFIARFRFYSPFNAMLIHIQMPGARFIGSPKRWWNRYRRRIKVGGRPLVILQPMGPVMFVFDVSDTEGAPLPREVEKPFEVRSGRIGDQLVKTVENAKRDGVRSHHRRLGAQQAGSIRWTRPSVGESVKFRNRDVMVRFEVEINDDVSREAQYATLVHELTHLYCGHVGTPNEKWWPDRRGLPHATCEFEAESVTYLLCSRVGIDNPSEQYLASYVKDQSQVPPISLDCVMKAAGLIEAMGRERLLPRRESRLEHAVPPGG